ncbi:ferritin-like domain-containing protein [Pseudalkalibacillus hwajinpoensis]|uniref:Ferritin-like domain-containing protein n=1 Tax=Guptibacillus hwajinpoensis TaxID=208199 RepID=A0A4U1MJW6_9BACL|nr:ferritin-like domain-containing protein [Pseudalkalibacillus hwajinpoensis]TKD70700.1 ferritin-like domain-containing protein [Pseudalkalibacillus hwajinpoensis]
MHPYYRTLVDDIATAINGEYSAIQCYKKLAQLAPNDTERNRIKEIRKDEKMHLQAFKNIYTQLTGQQPSPQVTEECPNEYREGIDFAFNDEQETVDFYLDIADQAQDPFIKETFKRAAADEQNHSVWFLYLLTKRR